MLKIRMLAIPVIFALTLLQACNYSGSDNSSSPSPLYSNSASVSTPEEVIEAYAKGWEDRDPAAVSALFADDGLYKDPSKPLGIRGKELEEYIVYVGDTYKDHDFKKGETVKIDATHYRFDWWFESKEGIISLKGFDEVEIVEGKIKLLQGQF
ncbi:nuclear transport factor 2 family protein [Cohnella faecalis]|uniref:Nuclear transport factor 2 family protein n=1 Tax=Cohnella faecalis TaxID=2315694 RepID=A0A398CQU0_9BACL|nr:nuclear transport factor 2 family protein [Cohnella faecalis]RIE01791.1 nuclear transport factor 2 family protein [Cohnella faecalis]